MKTQALFIILLSFLTMQAVSQDRGRFSGEKREKVESMKIGFLTKRLDLTPEEAQAFWPVYNQMSKEKETLRKNRRSENREAREDMSSMSDKEVEKLVDDEIAFRQAEVDLLKKYHGQFKQVLPIKKVALLYKSEDDFKRHLLHEIREKGGNRPRN